MKAVKKQVERVAAYLRVSTEDQAESGLGLDAQSTQVKAMAVVKGWNEPTLYVDAGITGMIDVADRPEGKRLLDDIQAGKIDAVIVSSLDRIGRRAKYILNFVDTTQDKTFVSCKESFDTSNAQGRFALGLFALMAEWERDTISERTIAALNARGKSVGIKSGLPPYGYRYEGREVYVVEEQAVIVCRVFALRGEGLTLRAVADKIEEETGTRISHVAVKFILDREDVYRGCKRGESDQTWPIILNVA